LATIAADGGARLVPVCFVVIDDVVWSPLDEKPKSVEDLRSLARVRDILERHRVSLLVDRWSEDWSELAWVRVAGTAEIVASRPAAVLAALRAKYPQYSEHDLEARPAIAITIQTVRSWSASPPDENAAGRTVE
jgi:PPOX class probable F420-dependent enzyme